MMGFWQVNYTEQQIHYLEEVLTTKSSNLDLQYRLSMHLWLFMINIDSQMK